MRMNSKDRVKRFPLRRQVMQILAMSTELSSTGCSNTLKLS